MVYTIVRIDDVIMCAFVGISRQWLPCMRVCVCVFVCVCMCAVLWLSLQTMDESNVQLCIHVHCGSGAWQSAVNNFCIMDVLYYLQKKSVPDFFFFAYKMVS